MNNERYVLLKYAGPNLPTVNGTRASRQTNIMALVTAKWDLQFSGDCHASFCLAMEKGTECTRLLLTSSFRSRLFIIFPYVSSWLLIIEFLLTDLLSPVAIRFSRPTPGTLALWVQRVRHAGRGKADTNWQSVSVRKSTSVCCHRINSKTKGCLAQIGSPEIWRSSRRIRRRRRRSRRSGGGRRRIGRKEEGEPSWHDTLSAAA